MFWSITCAASGGAPSALAGRPRRTPPGVDPGDPDQPADRRTGSAARSGRSRRSAARSSIAPAARRRRARTFATEPRIRSRTRPGNSPKTTTRAASGASVRISVGGHVGQVVAEAREELGQLAEERAAGTSRAGTPRRGSCRPSRSAATHGLRLERPDEDEELADEARQARQPGRGEDEEPERHRVDRHQRRRGRPSSRSSGRGSARRSRRRAGTGRPVIRPWLTIWRIAPCMPCSLNTKIPSVTKPMWLTEL